MKAYLDCGSTTPVSKEVLDAMLPYLTEKFGHPLFLYSLGQEAADAVEKAQDKIAMTINAGGEEIIFTSGATEANDLALRGVAYANRKRGNHIITTKIENPGVLRICERLEKEGFRVDYLPVDREGFVNLEKLESCLTDKTILVS
ncbi:MAG: aminotransferase class V-fold PLP-dependent enzyme, partial [Candidatus Hadarchaeales archaeon]